jgi:1-deoxy-D-xylulose-5-phosphate reductoisomerase
MQSSQKKISLLGSTGSIGRSTLDVVRHLSDRFQVVALAARANIDLLEIQAHAFRPEIIAVYEKTHAVELQKRLPHIPVVGGLEGLQEAAAWGSADLVVSAMTGAVGIIPTVAALEAGKDVALANKEVLVSAGEYVMGLARQKGVKIIPVDSEHSALFQCLNGESLQSIRRLILTASGGPFLHYPTEKLCAITIEQALAHPTWRMGPKVTIDCSNLMNKGLEVIEAHWLFGVDVEKIEVIIHPQSIIHSMVEYTDGSILAQMSEPNMIIPIQYALTYPERAPGIPRPFDFTKHPKLDFLTPDLSRFSCLELAFEALRRGGTAPCFLNAANEVLVDLFLKGKITWIEIAHKLEKLILSHSVEKELNLDKILQTDILAREMALIS